MIKVEANQTFTLKDFDKIKNTLKRSSSKDKEGIIYKGDTFVCDKKMTEYLKQVIDIIEIKP